MISNCLKIQEDLYSKGAKPPAFIDNFGFGIIFLVLISFTVPLTVTMIASPLGIERK
jgi:hypothetical protein